MFSQNPGTLAPLSRHMSVLTPSPERRALYPDGDWMRDNGGVTELLNKDQLIATAKRQILESTEALEFWTCLAKQLHYNFVCVKKIFCYFTLQSLINYWIDHSVCSFSSSPGNQIRIPHHTHQSLVHSLRIQFWGSHVCSRSLTLCVRVQVHYWSLEAHLWTSHSSETHSLTLETLLCHPLPPHNHSSSVWEEKKQD